MLKFEREAGVEISRATLDGWVMRVGDSLNPVIQAMRLDLLRGTYLQADETTVPVQWRKKAGANHQAYLWQYGRPGGETVFDFHGSPVGARHDEGRSKASVGKGKQGPGSRKGRQDCHKTEPQGYRALRCRVLAGYWQQDQRK